jgi:uncharacterized membrane protein
MFLPRRPRISVFFAVLCSVSNSEDWLLKYDLRSYGTAWLSTLDALFFTSAALLSTFYAMLHLACLSAITDLFLQV